jgi:hypothetical protein
VKMKPIEEVLFDGLSGLFMLIRVQRDRQTCNKQAD